jgi:GNAT superfamily N-acetyltransferase
MSITVKLLLKKDVKKIVSKQKLFNNPNEKQFWLQWLGDNNIKAYVLFLNDEAITLALLSKMDFDPIGNHSKPVLINYIYTVEKYRRQKYASKLIEHIKNREEFSAHCDNDASELLFEKSNCSRHDNPINPIYRWPSN